MVKKSHAAPDAKNSSLSLIKALNSNSLENASDLPSFDEKTLASLTKRIEIGLQKPLQDLASGTKKSSRHTVATDGEAQHGATGEVAPANNGKRGKKRDRQGVVKGHESRDRPKKAKDGRAGKTDPETAKDSELLQEILALGGTEKDLELIAGVMSGSEIEVFDQETGVGKSAKAARSLHKDIENFVKDLGSPSNAAFEDSADETDERTPVGKNDPKNGVSNNSTDGQSKVSSKEKLPSSSKLTQLPVGKSDANLMFAPRPDWHATELPDLPSPALDAALPSQELLKAVHEYAKTLLEADNKMYSSAHLSSTSSHRFLSTIMSSGTLSDKISALTLVVQESPVHTMKAFENLLGLAKKRSRSQAVTALGAMKDLLGQGVVLPPDRKLKPFSKQPGLLGVFQQTPRLIWTSGDPLPNPLQKGHLVSWAYEDWLKAMYFDMLKVLESWCNDEVEYARGRAVGYVWDLLREKPEQESNLLRLLVNKLGDPSRKIASKASFLLLQLETTHPLMKSIIISSIESEVLFRPGQSPHAKYYAVITLNQTILSSKEEDVATKLIEIYFGLFISLLKQADSAEKVDAPKVNKKGQLQGGGGTLGKMARRKAEREEATQTEGEVNEKLISALLTGVNRAFPFAKTDDSTFERHLNTLFKITHSSNFNTSIQALMLMQQLSSSKQVSSDRFYRTLYESILDPRLLTSSKQAMYLNLLFRSLKTDLNVKRVKAFAKRLLQVTTLHQPPFICGVLYMLRELEGTFAALGALIDQPEDGEEEEVFVDAPEEGDEATRTGEGSGFGKIDLLRKNSSQPRYDGKKRDPLHSNANKSCLWELEPFLAHFHPSVALFATRLLRHEAMPAKPDLSMHTLIHFLDRFVYRNARSSSAAPRGVSIMQPLGGGSSRDILLSSRRSDKGTAPVNTEAFWRKKTGDVAVDEVFFHKYFSQIGKAKAAGKERRDKKSQVEAKSNDENEDQIWKALVNSRPELEGSDEGDGDLEMDDLSMSDDEELDAGEPDGQGIGEGSADEGDQDLQDDISLDLGDDEDGALLSSDDDLPSDLDAAFQKELQTNSKEDLASSDRPKPKKRKKLRHLPTFASVDDYADMLADEDDE